MSIDRSVIEPMTLAPGDAASFTCVWDGPVVLCGLDLRCATEPFKVRGFVIGYEWHLMTPDEAGKNYITLQEFYDRVRQSKAIRVPYRTAAQLVVENVSDQAATFSARWDARPTL